MVDSGNVSWDEFRVDIKTDGINESNDEPEYFEAEIYWKDQPEELLNVIIKSGDVGEDDDDVFYYVDSEYDLKTLMGESGIEDFVVKNYKKID